MDRGICSSASPALVTRDGRTLLAGTGLAVEDVAAALARGEPPPGLTDEQIALAEAWWERRAAA
jgi:hypothetical protein